MASLLLLSLTASQAAVLTPPMGWNSWDCFKGNLNETGAKDVAATMSKFLAPSGYDILTIDEFWYNQDCASGSKCIDEWGRPQPNLTRWPSAAGGKGFKPFSDYLHKMGLRLGIHTLRGSVSQAAVDAKSPIMGYPGVTVDQIATTTCSWNKNWYAVNMSHPAAQPWLDSVYGQYAAWGVDLIKNDCIFAHNMVEDNIKGVSKAIQKTGRSTVYSLSPGGGDPTLELAQAKSISQDVNIYRVTNDWHGGDLEYHFTIASTMQPLIATPGLDGMSFPDLDMLNPYQNAKSDPEFKTQMTLWAIARSPLIYGADIRSSMKAWDASDFALLTNPEVLAVTKHSSMNRPVVGVSNDTIVWTAQMKGNGTTYVAVINRSQKAQTATVSFDAVGIKGTTCHARDVWARRDVQDMSEKVSVTFTGGSYQAEMIALSQCK